MFSPSPNTWQGDDDSTAADIVAAKDLRQITDYKEIEALCQGIVDDPKNAKQVPVADLPKYTAVGVICRMFRFLHHVRSALCQFPSAA